MVEYLDCLMGRQRVGMKDANRAASMVDWKAEKKAPSTVDL